MVESDVRRMKWRDGAAEVSRLLRGRVDTHEAIQVVTERVRQISGAEFAAVALLDRADPESVVYEAVRGLGLDNDVGIRLPLRGLAAATIEAGQPIIVDDLPRDERYDPPEQWRGVVPVLGLAMFIPLAVEETFGVLLVGWRRGSAEERLAAGEAAGVQIFADYAALAVQRARAQEERVRHERWREATSEMAQLLLREVTRDDAMRLVVKKLQTVSGADFAGIILADPTDASHACVVVFEGLGQPVPPDVRIPRNGPISTVLESGEPLVSRDYTHLDGYQPPPEWAAALSDVGLGMLTPLVVEQRVVGVLFAGWRRGSPQAQTASGEVRQVQTFADLAAIALQRVRTQDDREHLLRLDERNRIARDLNDVVLQQLFAASLQLKTARDLSTEATVRERIEHTIRALEETNHEIRSAIFRVRPDDADD